MRDRSNVLSDPLRLGMVDDELEKPIVPVHGALALSPKPLELDFRPAAGVNELLGLGSDLPHALPIGLARVVEGGARHAG